MTNTVNAGLVAFQKRAAELAAVANNSEVINQEMASQVQAKEVTQRGALVLMLAMEAEYGKERIASFPRPGSKDGNNPDIYEYQETKSDGGKSAKKTNFYKEFVLSMTIAERVVATLADITAAQNGEKTETNDAFARMGKADLEAQAERFQQQKTNLIASVKKAMQLHFQIADFRAIEGVNIRYASKKDDNGNKVLANTTFPIILEDSEDLSRFDVLSIPQFLSLSIEKAKKSADWTKDKWAALKNSGSRDTKKGNGKNKAVTVGNIDDAAAMIGTLAGYLEDDGKVALLLKKLNGKENSDHLLLSVFGLAEQLNAYILDNPEMKARHDRLVLAASKAGPVPLKPEAAGL